jgi:dTDP-glucose 4,6-dehydratase
MRGYWSSLQGEARHGFRFLHVSTDEVYGSLAREEAAFSETHRYEPNSPYSASKAASDHLVRAYHHTYGLPVLTTNCSNNYGPYHFPEKLIPLMIVNALAGKPCRSMATASRFATGCTSRTIAAPSGACSKPAVPARPTTSAAGTRSPTSTSYIRSAPCSTNCARVPTANPTANRSAYVTDRPGHDRRYAIDARKIERELGWKPAETFATGIRKTVQWYLDNQDWVSNVQSGAYRDWVEKNYGGRQG